MHSRIYVPKKRQPEVIAAISLKQPWASLLAGGYKQIETRGNRMIADTRLPLLVAIHASATWDEMGSTALNTDPFWRCMLMMYNDESRRHARFIDVIPLGAVLALGVVTEIVRTEDVGQLTHQERAFGNYGPGRYALKFDQVRRLIAPIPAKGSLGIWAWKPQQSLRFLPISP